MSREFWQRLASSRRDGGAREALGAVRALAQQGLERKDCALFQSILDVVSEEMLPKVKEGPPILAPQSYGVCEDTTCRSRRLKPPEVRGLFSIGGKLICIACRKRQYAALREQGVERWWEHESVKPG